MLICETVTFSMLVEDKLLDEDEIVAAVSHVERFGKTRIIIWAFAVD